MVFAAGMGCSVQSGAPVANTSSDQQFINVALMAAPTFLNSSGVVTVTMTDETAEIYVNAADSSLMVNGVQAIDTSVTPHVTAMAAGKSANIKQVKIVDGSAMAGEVVILNYINGMFGLGTTTTVGTTITFAAGTANTLVVKGTPSVDNWAIGATGISLTNSLHTPTKDITTAGTVGVTAFNFFLGDGDDFFTSAGNAAVGAAYGHAVSIYGGNGNDTLNEGTATTASETFSGGPGTDTVDYSARTAAVSVAIDPAGVITSGSGPTSAGDPTMGATEADLILDADVIKGSSAADYLMGGLAGKVTLNGGPGNDTFCQGDDTYASGTDTLIGGGGVDVVDYSLRTHSLTVVMDQKTASGDPTGNSAHGEADIIGIDVQNIKLGSGGGTYTGNTMDNTFFSNTAGTSTINGLTGNDTLNEGADADNAARETFHGGAGVDAVDYSARSAPLTVTMDDHTASGDPAVTEGDVIDIDVENLYGGTGADTLTGNALDNDIEGNNGGDTLAGLGGNDTLVGNTAAGGSDTASIHGNDVGDTAEPGAFNICVNAGASNAQVSTVANCQVLAL
ncbi:MAG TPA: calcium-binding protein [Polyangiaceae bacterium]|jgi:Ca2+-binding RTX toxin-like protein